MLLVIGPGAVGTVVAGYLSAAGRPVRVLCPDTVLPALSAADEIVIDRVTGGPPLRAPKPLLTTAVNPEQVTQIFICVKHPDLESVFDLIPPTLAPSVPLISMLNAPSAVHRLRERFPKHAALPASVLFNAQLLEPFRARVTTVPRIQLPFEHRPVVESFQGTGIRPVRAYGEASAWGKLLLNLSNAIAAATHSTFRDILIHPTLRACYADLLEEALQVLRAARIPFRAPLPVSLPAYLMMMRHAGAFPWWLARWKWRLAEGAYPSMVSDIAHGRPTEADALNGEIVRVGARAGVNAPLNARMVALVEAIGAQRPPQYLTPEALRDALSEVSG
ncbi:MAG: ketopantoate reductase family protein [Algiphilus sp.]